MKTLAFSMLLACLGSVFSAFATADSSCAFDLNENLTLTTQLHNALPEGIWKSTEQKGRKTVLQFHASGTADWFVYEGQDLLSYRDFSWSVTPLSEDEARLELAARDHSRYLAFKVEPACQSLKLTDSAQGVVLALEHGSADSKAMLQQKEKTLSGKWENTTYPFDLRALDGAYLKYTFLQNGKFERMLGCARRNIKESGEWWLAKDGQHLIMRLENGETTVAAIRYLELDEMVLKHVLNCDDENFATGDRAFFFNRQ